MAVTKRIKPGQSTQEIVKTVCYPCTSQQNDCSRRLNNQQATVEGCNSAYKLFGISPPPADYTTPIPLSAAERKELERQRFGPPKKVATEVATIGPPKKVATGVATTNSGQQGGLGTVLFAAFLPMSSYSSSCILSLCSIYFVVSAAAKQ